MQLSSQPNVALIVSGNLSPNRFSQVHGVDEADQTLAASHKLLQARLTASEHANIMTSVPLSVA